MAFFLAAGLLLPKGSSGQGSALMDLRSKDEILVKFKGEKEPEDIKIAQDGDFDEILADFKKNPQVEYAEPNYNYFASMIPTDTYYSKQWYLKKIKAPEAWDEIRESDKIIIAIIDSGVQIDHPDLQDNIWKNKREVAGNKMDDDGNGFIDDVHGWDFVNNVPDPSPKFKGNYTEAGIMHGTIVAGIAAASGNNAAGISGVTWKAQIMPLKVLDDKGEGNTNNVVRAIDYAIANGADIINLSFVGFGYSQSLDNAIKRAYDAGVIVVAAAGNEEDGGNGYSLDKTPMYPACHDGGPGENRVIGVAATDTLDQKASFSSYGFKCVDIAAPGVSVISTVVNSPTNYLNGQPFNDFYDGYWSGTSMATPMVSGALALIEAANPNMNRGQVISTLLSTADNINRLNPNYLNQLGKGRLNVYAAVSAAKEALNKKTARLLVAPFSGEETDVKITDKDGLIETEFQPFDSYKGGIDAVSGDIDGDGRDEIIVSKRSDGPQVKIFDLKGQPEGQFSAFPQSFRGGVNLAACDLNNDGQKEIITGAGDGGGPQVRIFDGQGRVRGQFFAYDKNFRGGVRIALGDTDGGARGHKLEIITAPGSGGGPHIRIFDNHSLLKGQFFAYDSRFTGGVTVAAGDVDNDGLAEIITGAGPGGTPHTRVFKANGQVIGSFYAFDDQFSGGVEVGVVEE